MAANMIYLATIWVIPVIIAITFHEAAHGFVAHLLGDDTAWRLGRVSFNPLKHVDPVGTILLPGILLLMRSPFLFGYAKPVPVNFRALRNPRRDMVLVAAAGPAMNIALANLAALGFHIVGFLPVTEAQWLAANLRNALAYQRRPGHVQPVSAPTSRWRTHSARDTSGFRRCPIFSVGAVRDTDPDRCPLRTADIGGAIGSRPQRHPPGARHFDRGSHRSHPSFHRQRLTRRKRRLDRLAALMPRAVFHRVSRTTMFADLIQNLPRDWFSGWRGVVARLDGICAPNPGAPREWRASFLNRRAARAALERVLSWPIDRVLIAHGEPAIGDGTAFVRHAFVRLLGREPQRA